MEKTPEQLQNIIETHEWEVQYAQQRANDAPGDWKEQWERGAKECQAKLDAAKAQLAQLTQGE